MADAADHVSEKHPDELTGGFLKSSDHGVQAHLTAGKLSKRGSSEPVRPRENSGRRTKLGQFGLNMVIINKGDPDYRNALQQANKYRKKRQSELAQMHGHVSSGAGALLASASLALAASRFLYERYARSVDDGGGCIDTLRLASKMADSARQSELSAWEMSSREGVLRRRQAATDAGMPWMTSRDGDALKSGRKSNVERALENSGNGPEYNFGGEGEDVG